MRVKGRQEDKNNPAGNPPKKQVTNYIQWRGTLTKCSLEEKLEMLKKNESVLPANQKVCD